MRCWLKRAMRSISSDAFARRGRNAVIDRRVLGLGSWSRSGRRFGLPLAPDRWRIDFRRGPIQL